MGAERNEATYRSKVLRSQQLLTITRQVKPPHWLHCAVHLSIRLYFGSLFCRAILLGTLYKGEFLQECSKKSGSQQ